MYARQYADFRSKRTNLINAASIYTLALIEPCANDFLLDQIQALINHAGFFAANCVKPFVCRINNRTESCIPFVLVIGIQCMCHLFVHHFVYIPEQLCIYFMRFKCELVLSDLALNLRNKGNHFFDFFMSGKDCLEHGVLRHFIGAGFNHYNFILGSGNCQVEVIMLALFQCRIQHDFAVYQTNADAGNRPIPRNI